ncbi:DUF4435 domain-containing protein [Pseudomonas carnis]|uniref:DUF4435 domain-containing protein n=1 Tax=Pseudomonas paracarnis TaxID=2750625 RepID=A0ABU6BLA9_9PSED|nr:MULTISPECIES: DUF4435 domain-containing protein [Pseudomonas]MBW9235745.1 DUF4435 domain-containing protein [Pseudomonas carnis]MEB3781068.1 DUF4435 domain-containing protein [Pseudomonas paracarnis]
MGSIRTYNGAENLRRIRMQKSTTFVVVEGSDDIPIYESCLSHMAEGCEKYDVVFAGGKTAIKEYVASNRTANAIFIIDRDFHDIGLHDERIISLDRYSIENYLICSQVISHSLKFALNCKFQDAFVAFDIEEYVASICKSTERLIKAIYYYQKVYSKEIEGERPAWSDTFLCQNNSWELCSTKIDGLITALLPSPALFAKAEAYYNENFSLPGTAIENFPGKMLKHSLQRYIKQQVVGIRPGARGKYHDVETTTEQLSAVIHKSDHMNRVLAPVVAFIRHRETP